MNASRVRRILKRIDEQKTAPNEFELYGSLRIRYRETGGEAEFQDGGSRLGAAGHLRIRKNYFLFARYESGFNLLAREETGSGPGEHKGGGASQTQSFTVLPMLASTHSLGILQRVRTGPPITMSPTSLTALPGPAQVRAERSMRKLTAAQRVLAGLTGLFNRSCH